MKTICNGRINNAGRCESCGEVSQTTSGYCTRLIDISQEEEIDKLANKIANTDYLDQEEPRISDEIIEKWAYNACAFQTEPDGDVDFDKHFYNGAVAGAKAMQSGEIARWAKENGCARFALQILSPYHRP